jgi:exopolyphosphatase / guanosine-5'-triphosphate,3'-diphosphate pyrophosphatase
VSQRVGVIDLGSNTSRLVIYEFEPGERYHLLDEVRELVRLREGMGESQTLRAAAIERAITALRMFCSLCHAMDVDDIVAVGTSAVRDARNREVLLALVESLECLKLRLLSGEEEGFYGALAAVNGLGLREGFVLDMGGGSVQVTAVNDALPGQAVSMRLGALYAAETYLGFEGTKAGAVKKLRARVSEELAELEWFKVGKGLELAAIGGTVRNLAAIVQREDLYPLESVDNYLLRAERVHDLADRLWRMSPGERRSLPGLQGDRADIIHAGAIVYSSLLEHSGFDTIRISRQGLREGLFYERFMAGRLQPVISDLRTFGILNLARHFGFDTAHSHHVARLALRLFDDLQHVHGLDDSFRQLLWAGGILHDVGIVVGYYAHHQHSSYIILNSSLPGYTPRERALISLLARYHRSRGTPKPAELAPLLEAGDEHALDVLAGILRLCEFFERGRHQVIRDLRCHVDKAAGWLQIEALAGGDAAIELWDASRNCGLLADALKMRIEIVGGAWAL